MKFTGFRCESRAGSLRRTAGPFSARDRARWRCISPDSMSNARLGAAMAQTCGAASSSRVSRVATSGQGEVYAGCVRSTAWCNRTVAPAAPRTSPVGIRSGRRRSDEVGERSGAILGALEVPRLALRLARVLDENHTVGCLGDFREQRIDARGLAGRCAASGKHQLRRHQPRGFSGSDANEVCFGQEGDRGKSGAPDAAMQCARRRDQPLLRGRAAVPNFQSLLKPQKSAILND